MTKIKLNWAYAQGELDTDTLKMLCIPARGKRIFGADEMDAELCIKDGWNLSIAEIHLGDVESSNILCNEIARRWNEFQSDKWHECKEEDTENLPKQNEFVLIRVEFECDGKTMVDYVTSTWNDDYGWSSDSLDKIADNYECRITHWKPLCKPKGVEK